MVVVRILSNWLERPVPLCPRLCLLGDKGQIDNISKGKFSVIMVGASVAARIILKHWKTPKAPQFKEWVNIMIKTASYEFMLYKLNNRDGTTAPEWEPFWYYITLTVCQQDDS